MGSTGRSAEGAEGAPEVLALFSCVSRVYRSGSTTVVGPARPTSDQQLAFPSPGFDPSKRLRALVCPSLLRNGICCYILSTSGWIDLPVFSRMRDGGVGTVRPRPGVDAKIMNQSGAKHNQNNAGRKGDGPSTAAVSAGQPAVASVDGNGHIPMLEPCPLCATGPRAEPRPRRHPTRWVVPATVLVLTAALFVVSDMLERHIFPDMSTGLRHALLTLRAAIVTGAGTIFMYWWMRRQEQRLSETAEEITGLLEAYRRNPSTRLRFENPHLVHCCKLVDCRRTDCPVNGNLDRRCWQVLGLNSNYDLPLSSVDIERCHECAVYVSAPEHVCSPEELAELFRPFRP